MTQRYEIGALILAAGASRRFGRDKLTANLGFGTVAGAVFTTIAQARGEGLVGEGLVVHRERATAISAAAKAAGLEAVSNPMADGGLSSSLNVGVDWFAEHAPHCTGVLVCLGDQPMLQLSVIAAVIAAARTSGADVVRPSYQEAPETPGHPVLLRRSAWALVRRLDGDEGLNRLIGTSALQVETVPVPGSNPDIDTERDLERIRGRVSHA